MDEWKRQSPEIQHSRDRWQRHESQRVFHGNQFTGVIAMGRNWWARGTALWAPTAPNRCDVVQRLKAEVRQRLLCGYSISSIEPKGVGIADLVLAMRAPCSKAADVHMGLPLGVVPHRATALKLSFGWFDPYGSVADDASADRVAASRLARSSLQSFGSSSRSSRTETR